MGAQQQVVSGSLKWKIADGIIKFATPSGPGYKITLTALIEEARKTIFTGKIGQTVVCALHYVRKNTLLTNSPRSITRPAAGPRRRRRK